MSWSRFFRRKQWDRERAEELTTYIEIETQDNIARGMSAEEARYTARRRLGNSTLIREEIYRMNSIAFVETFWQDLRYALRTLRNAPVFTATALLSLSLGIGANTAIFTLLYTVLLKPLPVPHPEALVVLGVRDSRQPGNPVQTRFSYPVLEALRARNRVFDGPFTYVSDLLKLNTGGDPQPVRAALVPGNYFPSLRVVAERGRTFSEADDVKGGAHPVAVVNHRLWQDRFAADPEVIGRVVRLNGYPVTIIGVMGDSFFGTQVGVVPDIWVPIRLMDRLSLPGIMLDNRDATWMPAMARLRPGISLERAEAEADATLHRVIAETYGEHASSDRAHLVLLPGSQGLRNCNNNFLSRYRR